MMYILKERAVEYFPHPLRRNQTQVGWSSGATSGNLVVDCDRKRNLNVTCVSGSSQNKDALISGTIARPPLPSLDRLPLGMTKHCHEVLGLNGLLGGA